MTAERLHRNSRQRDVILEELQKLRSHPSAAGLYRIVRKRLPRISLGTVYRNLELLSRQGTIARMDAGGPEKRFDGNPDRHYHIGCIKCGRLDDLHDMPEGLVGEPENLYGYRVVGHRLQFMGLCPGCQGESRDQQD